MSEGNKEFFVFDHTPKEFPMRQFTCVRRQKEYKEYVKKHNKELDAKFPYRISFYGDRHIGKMNWWQRLKMRYRLWKLRKGGRVNGDS